MNDEGPRMPASEALDRATLDEGYYAQNFATMLDTVVTRYGSLLRAREHAFVTAFHVLPCDQQRLYVRLLSRKGPCIRVDRLAYDEIADRDVALAGLTAAGFVDDGADAEPVDWLAPLLVAELRHLARTLGVTCAPQARKTERMAGLVASVEADPLRAAVDGVVTLVRPRHQAQVERFCLLFFGNPYQDWNAFLLRDLGIVHFEDYDLDPALRRFSSRAAIDDTLALARRRREVRTALDAGQLERAVAHCQAVLATTWHDEARAGVDRIAAKTGRALERAGRLHDALRCYAASEAPPARERRARVLARLGALDDAVRLCDEIAAAPRDEVERVFAPRFAHQLRRKRGEPIPPRHRPRRPQRPLEMAPPPAGRSIEQAVLDHLAEQGQTGFFAQNWLWKSLFGLAFWDEIFAPVPGAFEHPFQVGPLDLFEPGFRNARATAVEARLAWLRACAHDTEVAERLLATYDAKRGTSNALVSWHDGGREALAQALGRLGGGHLAWVFDRLSRDLQRYRRGFPDLFVATDDGPGFALYEVKGPGDQLRPEQGAWIDHLVAGGIPAYIVPVRFAT